MATPKKIFHKIGEVCELTKTEPYVLRYWESEFPFLAPEKNRAGQRIYTGEDIETVLAIKRLLYEEGYTTAGARRRLEKEREDRQAQSEREAPEQRAAGPATSPAAASQSQEDRAALRSVREGLVEIRRILAGGDSERPAAAQAGPELVRSRRPRR